MATTTFDALHGQLVNVQSACVLVIRILGGEIPEAERPSDEMIVGVIQHVSRIADRMLALVEEFDQDDFKKYQGAAVLVALVDARAIVNCLDVMTWSDGMKLYFSDHMMCALIDSIRWLFDEAQTALSTPAIATTAVLERTPTTTTKTRNPRAKREALQAA